MLPPRRDRDAVSKRFQTNMRRIGAIARFLPAVAGDDGVHADIMRAAVVFLHATLEDFIRSSRPKPKGQWTFNHRSDLVQVLGQIGVDPKRHNDLIVPLAQLAKRRIQIVHFADLDETEIEAARPWTMADNWELIFWNLAVLAFVYRIRKATGPVSVVEDRAGRNYENARAKVLEYANLWTSLDMRLPRDEIRQRLEAAERSLGDARDALKLDVNMFLDAEGNPLPGAVLGSEERGRKV